MLITYEPISMKIGTHIVEGTFNKNVQKLPNLPKITASTTFGNLKLAVNAVLTF